MEQERLKGATLHPKSGAAAERSYLASEVSGGRWEELPMSEVRGGSQEETPSVRGQWRLGGYTPCPRSGQRPGGATLRPRLVEAGRRHPTSEIRGGQEKPPRARGQGW